MSIILLVCLATKKSHDLIFPDASVPKSKLFGRITSPGFVWLITRSPSVKVNASGVIGAKSRLGGSGWATVNEPVRLHSGGHEKSPKKNVKGWPVKVYIVSALAMGAPRRPKMPIMASAKRENPPTRNRPLTAEVGPTWERKSLLILPPPPH